MFAISNSYDRYHLDRMQPTAGTIDLDQSHTGQSAPGAKNPVSLRQASEIADRTIAGSSGHGDGPEITQHMRLRHAVAALSQVSTKSGTISLPLVSGPRNSARHQLLPPIRQPTSIGTENPIL